MILRPGAAASDWDPALSMKLVAERTRAARDLLAGAPLRRPTGRDRQCSQWPVQALPDGSC